MDHKDMRVVASVTAGVLATLALLVFISLVFAGSAGAKSVVVCPGGNSFSVVSSRSPDGMAKVEFYLEPEHELVAIVDAFSADLLYSEHRHMTRGELQELYPTPCSYIDSIQRRT